jgi:hypothetical protein
MLLRSYDMIFWKHGSSMGRHKDGRLEPRSKAKHDKPAFEKYKKARHDLHPRFSQQEQGSSGRPSRATRGAPQYREGGDGDSSPSSDDDEIDDYRVEPRKRKSTDRGLDDDDSGDEEEIKEEEDSPVQHAPQGGQQAGGIHYGMLKIRRTTLPGYVHSVNYKAKGMTERAREQRRIDPRDQPKSCPYDHRFRTMF